MVASPFTINYGNTVRVEGRGEIRRVFRIQFAVLPVRQITVTSMHVNYHRAGLKLVVSTIHIASVSCSKTANT